MRRELKIDSEYESIIPKLSVEEFMQLEENILQDGILCPIVVWNNTIVDGHNRYKIATKHPEIEFDVVEKTFPDRYACLAWICTNQLGRRNLTPENRKYLIGRRYDIEKKRNGGDRKSKTAKSLGQNDQVILGQTTRGKIAAETNTTESFVKWADEFAKGVDAGEEACPGFKNDVLSGAYKAKDYQIASIAKIPESNRKQKIEEIKNSTKKQKTEKDKRTEKCLEKNQNQEQKKFDFSSGYYDDVTVNPNSIYDSETIVTEDTILNSLDAAVTTLLNTCNNYVSRFPSLLENDEYRNSVVKTLKRTEKYIESIERNEFNYGK